MLDSAHVLTFSHTHPLLPITPSPPTSVLINCCLHLHVLSLQNGLTALEVARASTDKVWDEEEEYEGVSKYDGVFDLLSRYTAEPAVLPGHPVDGTITTSSHYNSDAVFCFNYTGTGQHSRPTGHHH